MAIKLKNGIAVLICLASVMLPGCDMPDSNITGESVQSVYTEEEKLQYLIDTYGFTGEELKDYDPDKIINNAFLNSRTDLTPEMVRNYVFTHDYELKKEFSGIYEMLNIQSGDGFKGTDGIKTIGFAFGNSPVWNCSMFFLDKGTFCSGSLNDPAEYELERSEIESIKTALESAGKWDPHYHYDPFTTGMTAPFMFKIVIEYSDGTYCVFSGTTYASSEASAKWPKGFDGLKATLDGIVQAREERSF